MRKIEMLRKACTSEIGIGLAVLLAIWPAMARTSPPDAAAIIEYIRSYVPNAEYPAAGALFTVSSGPESPSSVDPVCSGALIAPRWFLTALHCFRNLDRATTDLKVFLPAEGIVDVRNVYSICELVPANEGPERGHPEECEREHDLALVEFEHSTSVWPPMEQGVLTEFPSDGLLVAYGATDSLLSVGIGIKSAKSVNVQSCGHEPGGMICHTTGHAACNYDSGGPLIVETMAVGQWLRAAVAHGRYTCPFGLSSYVDLSPPVHKDWIQAAITDDVYSTRHEIKWWGRVEQGHVGPGSQRTLRKTIAFPRSFTGIASNGWPLPQWINNLETVVEVRDDRHITLLRITMNYEHKGQNRFHLHLQPPESCVSGTCECQGQGLTFVSCDCENPCPGLWAMEVEAVNGAGTYQLLALPLGPETTEELEDAEGMADDVDWQRFALGPELHSGPILRYDTYDDGSASDNVRRFVKRDIEREIERLGLKRERDGPE